ncbi:DUF1576 domain-containing protein [Alkalibacterium indicireducens]|uniref:Uncharacterized protein n=1 Tax=Alkalibacterium indicireducens TaxID=398758 RepID=A0ABP3KP37_9LACT
MISENQLHITQYTVISQNVKYGFLFSLALFFASLAFLFNTPQEIITGQITILTSPANLTTDYFALSNVGATLFNVIPKEVSHF